ncbi:MAG: hypothetical protein ACRELA_08915, partial [Candidatus Rokuibacteriota bacterium]
FTEVPFLAQAHLEAPAVAGFLAKVERRLEVLPDEDTVLRHVAAMRDAAGGRSRAGLARLLLGTRRRRAAVLLAATLALGSTTMGLSYAGLFTFPKPVRSALSWLGLDMPSSPQRSGGGAGGGEEAGPDHTGPPVFVPHTPPGTTPPRGIPSDRGDRPEHPNGDHPGRPGGGPGDAPGGKGDRPDRPASPCPFPSDILGCDQGDGGGDGP